MAAAGDNRETTLAPMTSGLGFFTPDNLQNVNQARKLTKVQNIDYAFDTYVWFDHSCESQPESRSLSSALPPIAHFTLMALKTP
jgi:hypothetical protein